MINVCDISGTYSKPNFVLLQFFPLEKNFMNALVVISKYVLINFVVALANSVECALIC